MRAIIWLLAVVLVAAEIAEEPNVEEEDLEEPYNEYPETRSDGDFEEFDETIREKRCSRERRSAEYVRSPRQVHQYKVHEAVEEAAASAPPYEEMLAASAEHHHRVYVPSPQPRQPRAEVSAGPLTFGVHPAALLVEEPLVAPEIAPPVASVVSVPVAAQDSAAAGAHHQPHAHGHAHAGGHQHHAAHHGQQGGQVSQ